MKNYSFKDTAAPSLSLFTSLGTIVCCALPALFVSLGAGATLASLVSAAPWLITISKYKVYVFVGAGLMILIAGILMFKARNAPCPADAKMAEACKRLRKFSLYIYCASVLLYMVGFFFSFIAVKIFY